MCVGHPSRGWSLCQQCTMSSATRWSPPESDQWTSKSSCSAVEPTTTKLDHISSISINDLVFFKGFYELFWSLQQSTSRSLKKKRKDDLSFKQQSTLCVSWSNSRVFQLTSRSLIIFSIASSLQALSTMLWTWVKINKGRRTNMNSCLILIVVQIKGK